MYERQGKRWRPGEDQELADAFRGGTSVAELSARHQRRRGAIRSRLERLGLLERRDRSLASTDTKPMIGEEHSAADSSADRRTTAAARNPADPPPDCEPLSARISLRIDELIAALKDLQAHVAVGKLPERNLRAVGLAYERLDSEFMAAVSDVPSDTVGAAGRNIDGGDPAPERLRSAVLNLIRACVSKLKDRYIVTRVLGLTGDGVPATLAAVGEEFALSRERIRQRRDRAFRNINANVQRRLTSAAKLRAALFAIPEVAQSTTPRDIARLVVRMMTDRFAAARQLTLICCKAAGLSGSDLEMVASAAQEACRDPVLGGKWRVDHWRDIASQAIGATNRFESPPKLLLGRKRMPYAADGELITLKSEKLGRSVACESGTELRVFTWFERSAEIRWYQEQPLSVPYIHRGRARRYYPDAAVWDHQGRVVVVEVKPLFTMYREETLAKAIAALKFLEPRGIGYLLVDSSGATPAALAHYSYDQAAAQEIEALFAQGPVAVGSIRETLSRRVGRIDMRTFISMVLNRDWSVMAAEPAQVGRLPEGLSFRPLIQ